MLRKCPLLVTWFGMHCMLDDMDSLSFTGPLIDDFGVNEPFVPSPILLRLFVELLESLLKILPIAPPTDDELILRLLEGPARLFGMFCGEVELVVEHVLTRCLPLE